MQQHQREFLELAIELGALKFGEFTLKSGRVSPYFFNAGQFNTGGALAALGRCFAQTIIAAELEFDMLFGPAYKGIPLATATAVALAEQGRDVPFAYNRKEAKAHGEGGNIIGAPLVGRVLVLDDVITAGTAIREALEVLEMAGATPAGVVISLDREERGLGKLSAVQEVAQTEGVPVVSIARLGDLIAYLETGVGDPNRVAKIRQYREQYGVD